MSNFQEKNVTKVYDSMVLGLQGGGCQISRQKLYTTLEWPLTIRIYWYSYEAGMKLNVVKTELRTLHADFEEVCHVFGEILHDGAAVRTRPTVAFLSFVPLHVLHHAHEEVIGEVGGGRKAYVPAERVEEG